MVRRLIINRPYKNSTYARIPAIFRVKVPSQMLRNVANLIPYLRGELHAKAKTLKRLHGDVQQESQRVTPASSVRLHDLLVSLNNVIIKIDSYMNACLDLATFGGDSELSGSIKESLEKGSSVELVEFLEVLQSHTKTIIKCLDDILKGVIDTETLMSQSITTGDANTGQPVRVGFIAKVGVGIAITGAIYGYVEPSTWLVAASFILGVLAVVAAVYQNWHCYMDAGQHQENILHMLMENLKAELKCLRQEVDKCKRVGESLQEKLGNCILSGDFDSDASVSVLNFAKTCNELQVTLQQD